MAITFRNQGVLLFTFWNLVQIYIAMVVLVQKLKKRSATEKEKSIDFWPTFHIDKHQDRKICNQFKNIAYNQPRKIHLKKLQAKKILNPGNNYEN